MPKSYIIEQKPAPDILFKQLIEKYILSGCEFEINISSSNRKKLIQHYEKLRDFSQFK